MTQRENEKFYDLALRQRKYHFHTQLFLLLLYCKYSLNINHKIFAIAGKYYRNILSVNKQLKTNKHIFIIVKWDYSFQVLG